MIEEIDWEGRCRRIEAAVDYVLMDDLCTGIPQVTSRARQVLQDARRGRVDPYIEALAVLAEEQYQMALEREIARLRAKAARPWWVKMFPWRITIERRN